MIEFYKYTPAIDSFSRRLPLIPLVLLAIPAYLLIEIFQGIGNLIGWISNLIKIQAGVFSLDQYNDFEGWKQPATGKYYDLGGKEFGDKHDR